MGYLLALLACLLIGCGDDDEPDCSVPPCPPDAGALACDDVILPEGCDPETLQPAR